MTALVTDHQLPIQRACRAVGLSRAAYYRPVQDTAERDAPVIAGLNAVLEKAPRAGFWMCFDRLRRMEYPWNHKRVYRVYKALKLNLPRRVKRRLYRPRQPLDVSTALNAVWALDFMSDALYDGRKLRVLNVIDEANREALVAEVATSLPTRRVIAVLDALVELHGAPAALRLDNGPEFTSGLFAEWCAARQIALRFIQPGKPDQNAFIERYNRSFRAGVLDAYVFSSIDEVRQASDAWLDDYNHERPHQSLGRVPPSTYMPRPSTPRESTYQLST